MKPQRTTRPRTDWDQAAFIAALAGGVVALTVIVTFLIRALP